MKKTLITLLGIVLCGAAVAVEKPAGATMEQYVDALMRRMTLEEKIGQLNPVSYTHLDVYKRQEAG